MQTSVRHPRAEEPVFADAAKSNLRQQWSLPHRQPGEEHHVVLVRRAPYLLTYARHGQHGQGRSVQIAVVLTIITLLGQACTSRVLGKGRGGMTAGTSFATGSHLLQDLPDWPENRVRQVDKSGPRRLVFPPLRSGEYAHHKSHCERDSEQRHRDPNRASGKRDARRSAHQQILRAPVMPLQLRPAVLSIQFTSNCV